MSQAFKSAVAHLERAHRMETHPWLRRWRMRKGFWAIRRPLPAQVEALLKRSSQLRSSPLLVAFLAHLACHPAVRSFQGFGRGSG